MDPQIWNTGTSFYVVLVLPKLKLWRLFGGSVVFFCSYQISFSKTSTDLHNESQCLLSVFNFCCSCNVAYNLQNSDRFGRLQFQRKSSFLSTIYNTYWFILSVVIWSYLRVYNRVSLTFLMSDSFKIINIGL